MALRFDPEIARRTLGGIGRSAHDIKSSALFLSFFPHDAEQIVGLWKEAFLSAAASFKVVQEEAEKREVAAQGTNGSGCPVSMARLNVHNRCIPLLHLAHELMQQSKKMPRSFPDQFCTSIPTALAAIPVCDDIFFETRRLASEWLSSKLINDEAAKRILDCCTVPSYGQRLDWTSRNHDIVRVSRGIIDLTAAQAKVAAVTRKRKAALMSQGSPAAEDVSAAETDEVLKNAVDANKRLRRSVEDIKTSLQGTEECIQKFRIHVNQRRQRLLELLSDRGGDADTGAAADAAAADSTAAAAAASGGVDAAAGDEDASPVPAEQTEGGARSPVPTRGADDAADPSVPSGRVSPVPGTPPPEVLFTKGQKVVYKSKDGDVRGVITVVDPASQSYQVLLDSGVERNTEGNRLIALADAVDQELDELFADERPSPTPASANGEAEPMRHVSEYLPGILESMLETFSESAASSV